VEAIINQSNSQFSYFYAINTAQEQGRIQWTGAAKLPIRPVYKNKGDIRLYQLQ